MQLKNWEEYSDQEKQEILIYWFYENVNKYNLDKMVKKQFVKLINNFPDFVFDFVMLSRCMYNNDMLILSEAIRLNKIDYLCHVMDEQYLYIEASKMRLGKNFLKEIINSFEENVEIPNNQTYIRITISKPSNTYKSLKLD